MPAFNRRRPAAVKISDNIRLKGKAVKRRSSRRTLQCESLEGRRLLTSYLVDTVADNMVSDGFVSLREALAAANTNSAAFDAAAGQTDDIAIDTIRFAPTLGAANINLALGQLSISESVTISRGDATSVTIDGGGASRVFQIDAGVDGVFLRNLTITGGVADAGGGLNIGSAARVTLDNLSINGNEATGTGAGSGGGGVYNDGGELTIIGGSITGNDATGATGSGGGLFTADGDVLITATTIAGNTANRAGGGIEIGIGSLTLDDVVLGGPRVADGNIAGPNGSAAGAPGNGGGLHVTGDGGATQTLITISGGQISNNNAANEGGGVWNQAGVTMTITGGTLLLNNTAAGATNDTGGGGAYNNGGLLVLSDTRFRNNAATGAAGGGGAVLSNGGVVTISESLITGNFAEGASGSGGAILAIGTSRFNIIDTELSDNVASRAGGAIEVATDDSARFAVTLSGVVLNGNNAGVVSREATAAAPGNGGALHVTGNGNVLIVDGIIQENIAALEGGALWNGGGTLRIESTTLQRNTAFGDAADDGGGAIFNQGGVVTINGSTIADNVASGTSGSGGGIFNNNGRVRVSETDITGNTANRAGGGIEAAGADSSTSISDVNLSANIAGPIGSAMPGNGGGLHISQTGNASVSGGTVSGNVAASEGGGLWNSTGTLTVDGTTITGNVARGDDADQGGGGIYNNGGVVTISGAAIVANFATGVSGSGGGVLNSDNGTVTVSDSSITGNVANRAGGGVEATAGSTTTLNNVNLDGNNAGVGAAADATTQALLSYLFNETGTSALATGTASDGAGNPLLNFIGNNGNPADLHGGPGSGVSGAADDFAFDNTASTGFFNASRGQNAADFQPIDALDAFTLSGWFRLPAAASEMLGRQDALIQNATTQAGNQNGFRLTAGAAANSATLRLFVDASSPVESLPVFTERGEYVFFAVSYDGTQTADNVKFYKGTAGGAVTLVNTRSLNAGSVNDENAPLVIGVTQAGSLTTNPFNGLLDNIRIDNAAVSLTQLEGRRIGVLAASQSIVANPGNGGGLHISGDGVVEINDGTVNGNLAAGDGGGLWNSATGTLTVDGTVIANNNATEGGGVYGNGGDVTLTNVSVSGNNASESGGGIYTVPDADVAAGVPTLTITDSVIDGNSAGAQDAGSGGGGIFAAGSASVTNTDITNNTATEGTADGGGVLNAGRNFVLNGGQVSGNESARAGGGIEIADGAGFFQSVDTDYLNNVTGVNGGAIHRSGAGLTAVNSAEVTGNTAGNEGGGLWNSSTGTLAVNGSDFDDNSAMFGGAIFGDGSGGNVQVNGGTFTSNTADVNGGAIAVEGGQLSIRLATFTENSAAGNAPGLGGGAIFSAADNAWNNVDVIDNSADAAMGNGGGILIAEGGTGFLFGGTISGNTAGRAGGGVEVAGTFLLAAGSLDDQPTQLLLDGNTAGVNGGGLHISGAGSVTIRDATVSNNTADGEGGGLWNSANGTLIVDTTSVTTNIASGDDADQGGGGIYNDGGTVTLTDSDITSNLAEGTSGSGGGILNKGTLTATATAITGNTAIRAGGGIEATAGSTSNLTNVNLDNNNAVLDLTDSGADQAFLSYLFDETGTSAVATGTAADASGNPMLNFTDNSGNPADLRGGPGSGVSGAADDFAFNNTTSSGFFSASHGQHAADFQPIDALDSFTLSGWFRLPDTATETIGRQDAFIQNATTAAGSQAGYRLTAGAASNSATLRLFVDAANPVESLPVFTEIGQYVFFAVTYDGTQSQNNVNFYKGTTDGQVSLVNTRSLNAGSVSDENAPLVVGVSQFGSLTANPFNGFLDEIRIDVAALSIRQLESRRANAIGDSQTIRANPGNGGGLHISGDGNVTITGGTVSGNRAAAEGGGLWNSATGTLIVDSVTIENNVASGNDADQGGGAIYNDGGSVTVSDSTIGSNVANGTSGSGGGLLTVAGDVTVLDSTFEFNGANRAGGAIEIVAGTLSLNNTDLLNNDVNGAATDGAANPGNGGGLHVSDVATVDIEGGVVSGNIAASEGGGLWNQTGSTLTISGGTMIQANTALGDDADNGGGGIFNNGGVVNVTDAVILSNFADGASGSGGGILNVAGGIVTVSDTLIAQNVASRAGGGIEDNSVAGGTLATGNAVTLNRVELLRNNAGVITPGTRTGARFASPGNGGGLHVTGSANIAVTDSTVADNIAANEGGGLWNNMGTLTVTRSTVSSNSSPQGGGIYNNSDIGDIIAVNSTISGNTATAAGGGIYTDGGDVTLTSVTVANNDAPSGGGILIVGGTVTIGSSIVATNTTSNTGGSGADISGAITSADYNVIGNTAGATIASPGANDRLNVAARLSPLASNGGRTQTHALRASSPALGNGDPNGEATDQRGVTRPQGGGADSGAFESSVAGSAAVTPASLDTSGDGIVSPLDALAVINDLRSQSIGESELIAARNSGVGSRLDTNGDGIVNPLDALLIINYLREQSVAPESASTSDAELDDAAAAVFTQIANDDSVLETRRRQVDELLLDQLVLDALATRG